MIFETYALVSAYPLLFSTAPGPALYARNALENEPNCLT